MIIFRWCWSAGAAPLFKLSIQWQHAWLPPGELPCQLLCPPSCAAASLPKQAVHAEAAVGMSPFIQIISCIFWNFANKLLRLQPSNPYRVCHRSLRHSRVIGRHDLIVGDGTCESPMVLQRFSARLLAGEMLSWMKLYYKNMTWTTKHSFSILSRYEEPRRDHQKPELSLLPGPSCPKFFVIQVKLTQAVLMIHRCCPDCTYSLT